MICRDALEAEIVLYGDFDRQARNVSVRNDPGGEDHLDDLAQAWIDGDRERVLAHARAHEEKVRARMNAPAPSPASLREKIRELRKDGWSTLDIARRLDVSAAYIVRVCQDLPHPPKRWKTPTAEIHRLRSLGFSLRRIAAALDVCPMTAWRVLQTPANQPYYGTMRPRSRASATS